ncbi:unnamed protein product [Parnassius mnemosyne]|uniref:Ig-like domain-containing protein n=1 Tax=Parnassius mnemosyne TaxID=213953 RepID=A0AAV1LXG1_9NEOP
MSLWSKSAERTHRLELYVIVAEEPRLASNESNVTVVIGRDATLTCYVKNLQNYKVAWLRVDTQTILTIGQQVITKNHRIGVLRTEPQAWSLMLRDVKLGDSGQYMCQINTEPMKTQIHHLHVFVPPDIVDSDSSGEVVVREGESVALHCAASGIPQPIVTWKREDSKWLIVGGEKVIKWEGIWLNITSAHRDMNGALLCIASNGIPPSVSKRILLHVLCKPRAEVIRKMIGVYAGDAAILQCYIEAYPSPNIYWTDMYKNRLRNDSKHETKMISCGYEHTSILKINNVSRDDVGPYQCHAENLLGSGNGSVTLYTLATTTVFDSSTVQIMAPSSSETTTSMNYC